MKIFVEESGGRIHEYVIPTGLLLNRATALIIPGILDKQGVTHTREQCIRLISVIRACRREHPEWKLAEIQSSDGYYIEISL